MNRQMRSFPIPEGLEGMRADAALAKLLGLSRSATAQLCAEGSVTIDSQELGKSERLTSGNVVSVLLPEPEKPLLPREELVEGMDVLYSDVDIICVHKPVGVAAHPSVGWDGPTVIGGLRAAGYTVASSGPTERQGIVHRLDVGTSGVMVVASSERAYSALKHAFKYRSVKKTYHAVVQGLPDPIEGTVDAPIGRHPKSGWKFAVLDDGKAAVTHYSLIEAFREASLIEVHLETGRTHQIRVHMSATGHPCVGDPMYGSDPNLAKRLGLQRQWLHAVKLGFTHPGTGKWFEIEAPYPADLEHALEVLRG